LAGKASIHDVAAAKAARGKMPAPPFIVPAVRDALLDSRYKETIFVVPGEADAFCAAAALDLQRHHSNQTAIFSSDSDSAVYDVGPTCTVVNLTTLTQESGEYGSKLKAMAIRPSVVASKIGSSDLFELAYYLSIDTHISAAQAQTWLGTDKGADKKPYGAFVDQYRVDTTAKVLKVLREDPKYRHAYLGVDARVCEIAVQVDRSTNASPSTPSTNIEMYMPFLVEDTARKSAWRFGTRTRDTAYALLLAAIPREQARAINEHKRAGTGLSSRLVEVLSSEALSSKLKHFSHILVDSLAKSRLTSSVEKWRHFIVETMLWDYLVSDVPFPTTNDLTIVVLGRPLKSWHLVQLAAHYQATYYSLRMLRQIATYVRLRCEHVENGMSICTQSLLHAMEFMPGFAEFLEAGSEGAQVEGEAVWAPILEEAMKQIDVNRIPLAPKKKRRKQSKKLKSSSVAGREVPGTKAPSVSERSIGSNPFAALAS
jgi:hypothetical protein